MLQRLISTQVKMKCRKRFHFIVNFSNCLHVKYPIDKINDITSKTLSTVRFLAILCESLKSKFSLIHFVKKVMIAGCF